VAMTTGDHSKSSFGKECQNNKRKRGKSTYFKALPNKGEENSSIRVALVKGGELYLKMKTRELGKSNTDVNKGRLDNPRENPNKESTNTT